MKFISQEEGYIEPDGAGNYSYVYQYKDHLGNIRLSYSDSSDNGLVDSSEILQEKNYYPFGLLHKGYNNQVQGTYYSYGFNGKEEQNELNLEWNDFGARNYDATLGRWMNLDPLAELMRRHSPYNHAFNNPLRFIDPDGMAPNDIVIDGDKEFRQKTLEDLQALTTETLEIDENGTVTISGCGGTDTCSEGSDLVSDLVNNDKVVTIVESSGPNETQPVTWDGYKENFGLGEEKGTGTDSTIYYNPDNKQGGEDVNGSAERPAEVGLAHELGHARDFAEGIGDLSFPDQPVYAPETLKKGLPGLLDKNELKARLLENKIRRELGLPERLINGADKYPIPKN